MKNLILSLILLTGFIFDISADRKTHYNERYYQKLWCDKNAGIMEVVMPDRTRCDCVTETHAVEVDFAKKWAESIGQALHYSRMTGKRGGIVLIGHRLLDQNKMIKVSRIIKKFNLPIDLFIIKIK